MRDGMMRGVAAGMLMGAGALWAYGAMNKSQKRALARLATDTAGRVAEKANGLLK